MNKQTDYTSWGIRELIARINELESKVEHNGWSNYATWRVNLELIDGLNPDPSENTFKDIGSLSIYIKDNVETILDNADCEDDTIRSYANAFIAEVNYYEIAEHVAECYPSIMTGEDTVNGEKI